MTSTSTRIARAAALCCAVPIAMATAGATAQAAFHETQFQTPSHRIVCGYVRGFQYPPYVRCDLLFLNDRAAFLTTKGKGSIREATDAIADTHMAKVLAYGRTRRLGPFSCTSRVTGLTCVNRRTQHGFVVSREQQRGF